MKLIVYVEDGRVQDIISDSAEKVEYMVVDYNCDASAEDIVVLDGGDAYAYISDAVLDKEIVDKTFLDFNQQSID